MAGLHEHRGTCFLASCLLKWLLRRGQAMGPHSSEADYCETLEDKFEPFVDGNELVPVLSLLDAVNIRATSLLPVDPKIRKLASGDVVHGAMRRLQMAAEVDQCETFYCLQKIQLFAGGLCSDHYCSRAAD